MMYTYNIKNWHLVLQVWSHESKHYIRLQTISNKVNEFISNLTETYDSRHGFIKVFYYLEPISIDLMKKVSSYFELFYDAVEIVQGTIFETRKDHPTGEEVVKVIRKIIQKPVAIELISLSLAENDISDILNKSVSADTQETPDVKQKLLKECDFSYNTIAQQTLEHAQTLNKEPLMIEIRNEHYEQDSEDQEFPLVISSRTLAAIVKSSAPHFDKAQLLAADSQQSAIFQITPEDYIRIKSASFEINTNDLAYVLSATNYPIDNIYASLKTEYKWSWEASDQESDQYHFIGDSFDLQSPEINYDPVFEKIMGHALRAPPTIPFAPPSGLPISDKMIPSRPIQPPTQQSLLDKYFDLPSVSKFAKSQPVKDKWPITSVENSKPVAEPNKTKIFYIKNIITNECKLIKESVQLLAEQSILHSATSHNADDTIRVVSDLFDLVTHRLDLTDSNSSALFMAILSQHFTPHTEESLQITAPICTCDICSKPHLKLSDITQHQLIQHFISHLGIKSETEWSTSSELQSKIEWFIGEISDYLRSSTTIAINKNQVSQSVSEFLIKKRRVIGMTFNCRLPTEQEIHDLVDATCALIKKKQLD